MKVMNYALILIKADKLYRAKKILWKLEDRILD
jgi:hypothetical protein